MRPLATCTRMTATLLAATLLAACGGDDDGGGADGGAVRVVATGRVVQAMEGARFEDLPPLVGAEVCLHDAPDVPCVETASDGTYRLEGLPAYSDVALAMRHADHQGALVPLVIDERPPDVDVALEPIAEVRARNAAAGVTATDDTGSVGFVALGATGAVAGVRVELAGGVVEPTYVDAAGEPDAGLEATTERGYAFAVGVPPGSSEATFSHDSGECGDPLLGWMPSDGGDVRFPVAAGLETTVAVQCTIR